MERSEAVRLEKERTRRRRGLIAALAAVFAVALAVRVYCAVSMKGYLSDQHYFVLWMNTADTYGLGRAYSGNGEINYPPLLVAILWVYKQVLDLLGIAPTIGGLAIKLPVILFDVAAMAAVLRLTRHRTPPERVGLFALFALNPVFILDGAVWGQVDMLHSLLMLTAFVLLPKRPGVAGAVYALACLAKFQSVAVGPIFAAFLLRRAWEQNSLRQLLRGTAGFAAMYGGALVYFAVYGNVGAMIRGGYMGAVGLYPHVTLHAMNIWYYFIGTAPETPDFTEISPGFTLRMVGFLFLGLAVLAASVYMFLGRRPLAETVLKAGALANFSFFMLPTEIHERYCMPALVFALIASYLDPRWRRFALLLTLTAFFNMMMPFTGVNPYTGMGLVWLNVYLLYAMFAGAFREIRPHPLKGSHSVE